MEKQAKLDHDTIKGREILVEAMKETYDHAVREGFHPRGRSLDIRGIDLAKDYGVDLFWVTWEVTPHIMQLHLYRDRFGAHSEISVEIAPEDGNSLHPPGVATEVSWKVRGGRMDAVTAVARSREHLDVAEFLCGIEASLKEAVGRAGRIADKDKKDPNEALELLLPAVEQSQGSVWSLLREHLKDYDGAKDW